MAKPLDEEPLDRYVNRPVARPITRLLLPLPISANQVSLMAAVSGILAGVALGLGPRWAAVAAVLLGWGAMVLDCVDGQLARARGGGTRFGYLLDGAADYVIAISTHLGFIALALSSPACASFPAWAVVGVVVLCGAAMAAHSSTFEAVKFRYRASQGGDPGAHMEKQREILESLESEKGLWIGIARGAFRIYYQSQKRMNEVALEGGPLGRGVFFLAVTLGPTLRLAVLLGSALAAAWWPRALWIYPAYTLLLANVFYVRVRLAGR